MNYHERISSHPYKKCFPVKDKLESDKQSKLHRKENSTSTEKLRVVNKNYPLGILHYILD
jgi:hypothetical protein